MRRNKVKTLILTILLIFSIHAFADEYADVQTSAESAGVEKNLAAALAQKTRSAGYSTQNMAQIRSMIQASKDAEATRIAEKVMEGIAKNVPENRVVMAAKTISERYAFARQLAVKAKISAKASGTFSDTVTDAMAAGAGQKNLDRLAADIAGTKEDRDGYALAVTAMYREMARYGVPDATSSEVAVKAMKKLNVKQINEYRESFMQNAGYGNAGSFAENMGRNIEKGRAASSMGSGGSGSGSGGSSSGGSGGSGGGGGNGGGGGHR